MELLSVTLTRAPLGLKLDAYGFLAAVLDTAEDATRRALRPCDELIGINGTLYDDIPTESTPDAAAELVQLGEPEVIGAVDQDRVGARDVDAVLDDGGGDQHVELAAHERAHRLLDLHLGHLAVADRDLGAGREAAQPVGQHLKLVDAIVQHEDLPAARELPVQRVLQDLVIAE